MDIKNPIIKGLCGLLLLGNAAYAEPNAEDCGPVDLAELSDVGANDNSIPVAETFPVSGACELPNTEEPSSPFGFTKAKTPSVLSSTETSTRSSTQSERFTRTETQVETVEVAEYRSETVVREQTDPFAGAIEVGTISADPEPSTTFVAERRPAPRPVTVQAKPRPRYVRPKTAAKRTYKPRKRPAKKRQVKKIRRNAKTAQHRLTTQRYRSNPPIIDRECRYIGGCGRRAPIVIMEAAPIETVRPKYVTKDGQRLTLTDTSHRSNPPIRSMACPANPKTYVIMRAE